MIRFYPFYALLAALWLVFPAPLTSQIVYTDIEPDAVVIAPDGVPFEYYYVDLNNDNKDDIRFAHFVPDADNKAVEVYSYPDDPIEAIMCDPFSDKPSALEAGFAITAAISSRYFINTYNGTSNSALFINTSDVLNEPWDTGEDRYLGVMIEINDAMHYGWIRLNMPADASSFTVKDYAIEMTAENSIIAGDRGTTAVDDLETPSVDVRVYGDGSEIIVEAPNALREVHQCILYNLLGKPVGRYSLTSSRTRIPMQSAPAGVYFVVVSNSKASVVRKATVW